MRHWYSIARRLNDRKPHIPIMTDAEPMAREWADGFMRAVAMRMDVWDPRLARDEELNGFLGHILMLAVSPETAAEEGVTPEKRAKMVEGLPLAILGIHLYWRERPVTGDDVEPTTPVPRVESGFCHLTKWQLNGIRALP